ncbi:uncharacterized protein LOC124438581 [Xenia sp. Carnegie-2017]|uniref:uncharacterized protein LOC124438581 n=1 Tax=Xenia sp. Carnegie-2017 TaxID=2897299 RepID=UPI001F03C4EF|nr:uncharacterized protein LOC124438581 [Xenia sp. Carnegie-2017]
MKRKGRRIRNVVTKLTTRKIFGNDHINAVFPRSHLEIIPKFSPVRIRLRDIEDNDVFGIGGHVLLGFTNCGEYVISYLQDRDSHSLPFYKYTLHWWKFDLRRPLREVCSVSLFEERSIMGELKLLVCQTFNDDRIVVHGCAPQRGDEQTRQCFVTICTSPPRTNELPSENTWAVHMMYTLLSPFPKLVPQVHLKLKHTVIINSVDSVHAITIVPCAQHASEKTRSVSSHTRGDDLNSVNTRGNGRPSSSQKSYKYSPCTNNRDINNSIEETRRCDQPNDASCIIQKDGKKREVSSMLSQVELFANLTTQKNNCMKSNNCDSDSISSYDGNENPNTLWGVGFNPTTHDNSQDAQHTSYSYDSCKFSSFNYKTFCNSPETEMTEGNLSSPIIESSSSVDIQVETVENDPYDLTECLHGKKESMKAHTTPRIHTRIASFEVEPYIHEVVKSSFNFDDRYWVIKNYNTQVVDICESTNCVVIHITVILFVHEMGGRHNGAGSPLSLTHSHYKAKFE